MNMLSNLLYDLALKKEIKRLPVVNLEFGSMSIDVKVIELADVIVQERVVNPDMGWTEIGEIDWHQESTYLGQNKKR